MKNTLFNVAILSAFILIFGFWSIHLGQDMNWDLKNYHFYNAYAFINNRMHWDLVPDGLPAYTNPFLDLISYFLITTQKPVLTGFILGALSGISAFVLFLVALTLFSEVTSNLRVQYLYAFLATIIGSMGCGTISQLGTTSNENKTALLIVLALYFIVRSIKSLKPMGWIMGGGLLIGLATGFKLTAAPYGVGILIGFLACQRISKKNLLSLFLFGIFSAGGFLISNGYWMWKVYHFVNNPFFPYYNNIFHSTYYYFTSYAPSYFTEPDLIHYILLPFLLIKSNSLTIETSMIDYRFAVVFTLASLLVIKHLIFSSTPRISTSWRLIFIFFITSYILWLFQFMIYRYTIPLEYCAGLAIIYFLQLLIPFRVLQIITVTIVSLLMVVTTHYPPWATRTNFGQTYFSISSPKLPKNSLVLMVNEPIAYVIPFLHSETPIRFVGIDNSLSKPTNKTGLQDLINQTVMNHAGPKYILFQSQDNERAKQDLKHYELTQINSRCAKLHTNAKDDLILCPVKPL